MNKNDSTKKNRIISKGHAVWLVLLLLVFAANHIEYHFRLRSIGAESKKTGAVIVKSESSQSGHASIGIDETSISQDNETTFLRFSTLGSWNYDPVLNTPCPESIKVLNGRTVSCIGFMYPLEAGSEIKLFVLMRSTQTCCYGPKPQYNQYLFVESEKPVPFERKRPVIVDGRFFVDPKPEEGYIYRLSATRVVPVKDDMADINAAEAAQKADLPLFDFSLLEKLRSGKNELPAELLQLNKRKVVISGFLVGNYGDSQPVQVVGKLWWDGVMQGTPPDLYNAVMVFPKNRYEAAPAWKQKVIFTGILNITDNKALYGENGIISIRDAVRGIPGQHEATGLFDDGPFMPVWVEIFILILFSVKAFKFRRTAS